MDDFMIANGLIGKMTTQNVVVEKTDDLITVEDTAQLMGMSLPKLIALLESDNGIVLPSVGGRAAHTAIMMPDTGLVMGRRPVGDYLFRCDVEAYMKEKGLGMYQKEGLVEENAKLEKALAEAENQLADAKIRIGELEAQGTGTEAKSTANAARWESSVQAAFALWADIIARAEEKTNWKKQEFEAALAGRCEDYHSKVLAHAWSNLPDRFKHGAGRPKNPDNLQHPEITGQ